VLHHNETMRAIDVVTLLGALRALQVIQLPQPVPQVPARVGEYAEYANTPATSSPPRIREFAYARVGEYSLGRCECEYAATRAAANANSLRARWHTPLVFE
jgi:hypothetical protein